MDLTDTAVAASLLESTKASVSYDGKIYALPYQQQIIACFYNPDLNAGMFALPVSDEAEWNKLAIDVSVGIAVNADLTEEKKAAVMKVLEYMYGPADPTGRNSIAFSFPGAGVPSVAFTSDVVNSFNYYNDYMEYAQSGNVFNWIYQQLPAGTDLGAPLQGYGGGLLTQEEAIAMLDEANEALTF